jgi:osmotically inducible lipoprotein OsmB
MTRGLKKQIAGSALGLSLLALGAAGCGTLTGATLGGAAGAGIGAATGSRVGRSAAIGAGVGGTAGALYDVYNYSRRDSYSGRYDRYRD